MYANYSQDTMDKITRIARTFLRDYPKFFQVSFDAIGRTYELGQPNIQAENLWVARYTPSSSPVEIGSDTTASAYYSLDERNGVMRFNQSFAANTKIMVEGYYYEWVLPKDLEYFAAHAIEQHIYNLDVHLENFTPIIYDTIGMATVVETLWGLLTEYSRDIDVTTSESVHIPASQRFRMVQSMLDYWTRNYQAQARALNIGLERIEIMTLRRVSRTTGYLVPIYRERELGDRNPIERQWPEIGHGDIPIENQNEPMRENVYLELEPEQGYSTAAIMGW
jgi:hypothetical protein